MMKNRFENHYYNKMLQPYASRLRKRMTKAGFTVLWFDDNQILNNIGHVHSFLSDWIDQQIK